MEVLDKAAQLDESFRFEWTTIPWCCDDYVETGKMMPEDEIDILKGYDQISLSAVGYPELVPAHISLWGRLIKIRREMKQLINVRPAKCQRGLPSPLRNPSGFDFVVVRENSEGEYLESGGRIHSGQDEVAFQNAIFTRKGTGLYLFLQILHPKTAYCTLNHLILLYLLHVGDDLLPFQRHNASHVVKTSGKQRIILMR